jgi:Flp pilus assembly protein TadG
MRRIDDLATSLSRRRRFRRDRAGNVTLTFALALPSIVGGRGPTR